ncbi:MAG TPA: YceI family protein [Candidatus Xenobia bacterium]|jgi:polyisoprenoid-binding protein YceI
MALQKWNVDPLHSHIAFSVRHLLISKVTGHFNRWTGDFNLDEGDPKASRIEVTIDASSVDTRVEPRDNHLRSADFFDVEKFPTLTFKSTSIDKVGESDFKLHGDLTIHGVTRPVTLDVEFSGTMKDPWGGERGGFSAHAAISRKDFGLTYNQVLETGGVAVGDKVDINIEVEAVKAVAVPT